jgi:hypothetical protein
MSSSTTTLGQLIGQQSNPSTSCVEGSPVKISALQESELALTENDQDYGLSISVPFAHFDRATFSWRTCQVSLLTLTWDEFSETWPRAGTMRSGQCYQRPHLERPKSENEYGFLPTPTATDWKRTPMKKSYAYRPFTHGQSDTLAQWAVRDSGLAHARLVPHLWEWLMGFPEKWTALEGSATPSSRKSRKRSDG